MKRRDFVSKLVAAASLMPLSSSVAGAWSVAGSGSGRSLVILFLRGGCDGLNMIVPYADQHYYNARPRIAIAPPRYDDPSTAIDIDGYFGLHPALAPLRASYDEGRLALLPAVHFPDQTRSHFHAQAIMERAGGGAGDGWLNRYLMGHGASSAALAISHQVPEALQGHRPVPANAEPLDQDFSSLQSLDDLLRSVVQHRYELGGEARPTALEAWQAAASELEARRSSGSNAVASSVSYPDSPIGKDLAAAAALLRENRDLAVLTLSMDGWDTHSNQGGATGRQASQFAALAAGLSAFDADLGLRRDDVAVLVQTEFGRTLKENASGGTDHGGASAWMVLSSTMRGGVHFGTRGWPGLDEDSLLDRRALSPAIDFRDVYADILTHHLGCGDLSGVLPGRRTGITGLV